MLLPVILLAMLTASHFFRTIPKSNGVIPDEVVLLYARWKAQNNKLYATPAENGYRLRVFYDQKQFVDKSNADYESAISTKYGEALDEPMFSLNGFADLTEEEFEVRYTGDKNIAEMELQEEPEISTSELEAPAAGLTTTQEGLGQGYDLRIRSQGTCGSCWAFSTIASMEKLYFDKFKARVDFSQQELVDCDTGNSGCNGGLTEKAMAYIKANGITMASNYPYTGASGACKKSSTKRTVLPIVVPPMTGFTIALANAYSAKGYHATVSVYASGAFRYFSSASTPFDASVSDECKQTKNHAINMLSAGNGIVTVFNSWGTKWGVSGTKAIKPCGPTNLFGNMGRIAQPYGA